jgi:hypothetical protein
VLIERKEMRDVLVWTDDNDAPVLAAHAPPVEDVTGGWFSAKHLLVVVGSRDWTHAGFKRA